MLTLGRLWGRWRYIGVKACKREILRQSTMGGALDLTLPLCKMLVRNKIMLKSSLAAKLCCLQD